MERDIYVKTNSPVHNLHPSTKILSVLLLFILSTTFNHPLILIVIFVFTIVLALISGSFKNILRFKYIIIILSLSSVILWTLLLKEGNPLFTIFSFNIYKYSLFYGISMALRLSTMIITGIIFISTTSTEEFTYGLRKLKLPYVVSFAISLSFRMVPAIFNTTAIVSDAQKSRGYHPSGGGLIKRIKRYIPLIVPVLLYTIRNATRISIALESKGFMRKNKRTDYIEYTFRFSDILLLSILIIIVTSGIILRVNGYGEIIDRI